MSAVRVGIDSGIARVVIDRPDRKNAFDAAMIAELTTAIAKIDPSVRAVVLRTEDLDVLAEEMPEVLRQLRTIAERRIRELEERR